MTVRDRWLAAVECKETDRLMFWPKIEAAYTNRHGIHFGFESVSEFHEYLGSEVLYGVSSCVHEEQESCRVITKREGRDRHTWIDTPLGPLHSVYRFDEGSQAWHPTEFAVKTAADIERMICYVNDISLQIDEENIAAGLEKKNQAADHFFSWEVVGESPLMYFVEHLAGIEGAHYMLADNQTLAEDLFTCLHELLKKKTTFKAQHSVADLLVFIENTSTTLISPTQYVTYCAKHIRDYSAICDSIDRKLALHMCGHLKDLLPELANVGARVFEAFTSPTVGNTPFSLGREQCPEICLIGGTNAALWTQPASTIIGQIEKDLAELPHHRGIVLSSAGVMPPMCEPDTIKQVCDWVHNYPVVN